MDGFGGLISSPELRNLLLTAMATTTPSVQIIDSLIQLVHAATLSSMSLRDGKAALTASIAADATCM